MLMASVQWEYRAMLQQVGLATSVAPWTTEIVRSSNQLSRAREKVLVAAGVSISAGKATMRTWTRAPANLPLPRPPQPGTLGHDDPDHGGHQRAVDEQYARRPRRWWGGSG